MLFNSDLVQLDLFSPFPISLYNSSYVKKAVQRIKFLENKINYIKNNIKQLWNSNLFKKIYIYMFWIVYAMKYQKIDKEEILCELRIALREKLRKLFILVPIPKDKYYELIPLILGLSIELTLNGEISTVHEKGKDSGSASINTYDFECKLDLFQTVYYESIGFLPSVFFIENIFNKFTKSENKMGINTAYFNDSEKKVEKAPILKGIKKNLWNILNTFYLDQSKNNTSVYKNSSRSRLLGNAFAANSNIIHPVSSKTLPPLSLSPSRMSEFNMSEISENRRLQVTNKEKDYQMRLVKFDTSTLSPCFDHIYKAQMFASPSLTDRTHQVSMLPSDFGNSTQTTMTAFSPPKKPMKLQILKSCHSLMLNHMSQYEADTDKKWTFQVMLEQYNQEEKQEKEEALQK